MGGVEALLFSAFHAVACNHSFGLWRVILMVELYRATHARSCRLGKEPNAYTDDCSGIGYGSREFLWRLDY